MKKLLLFGILLLVLSAIIYFAYSSYHKIEEKRIYAQQVRHLPQISTFEWIGSNPKPNKFATIILFFHPECEHCQYEAQAITENQKEFEHVNLWWISIADSIVIDTFAQKYHLKSLPNTYLAHLDATKVEKVFGSISIPHIFIYDDKHHLQKEFKGETKVEALLKYLDAQ